MLTIYGISNCDSCRRARKWLEQRDIDYRFHDVRQDGLETDDLDRWIRAAGWRRLLNTRGTTWRTLGPADKEHLSEQKAIALMLEHPTLLKRPVAEKGDVVLVGFSEDGYAAF